MSSQRRDSVCVCGIDKSLTVTPAFSGKGCERWEMKKGDRSRVYAQVPSTKPHGNVNLLSAFAWLVIGKIDVR